MKSFTIGKGKMELLAVMYHYIFDDRDRGFRGMHYIPSRKFRSQVEKILKTHEPLDTGGVVRFLSGKRWRRSKRPVVFTFDDGLRCHYENVFPFFRNKGIPGIFSVITSTLSKVRIPFVHKAHLLQSRLGDHRFKDTFLNALRREIGQFDLDKIAPLEKALANYRWNIPEIRQFKYLINFVLSEDVREKVIDSLFSKNFRESDKITKQFYMNEKEISELAKNGMEIGGHSHQHKILTHLSKREQERDVEKCLSTLEDIIGKKVKSFVYPFGRPESFDETIIRTLKSRGVTCAFTTIAGKNLPGGDCFAIRRMDSNAFKQ